MYAKTHVALLYQGFDIYKSVSINVLWTKTMDWTKPYIKSIIPDQALNLCTTAVSIVKNWRKEDISQRCKQTNRVARKKYTPIKFDPQPMKDSMM